MHFYHILDITQKIPISIRLCVQRNKFIVGVFFPVFLSLNFSFLFSLLLVFLPFVFASGIHRIPVATSTSLRSSELDKVAVEFEWENLYVENSTERISNTYQHTHTHTVAYTWNVYCHFPHRISLIGIFSLGEFYVYLNLYILICLLVCCYFLTHLTPIHLCSCVCACVCICVYLCQLYSFVRHSTYGKQKHFPRRHIYNTLQSKPFTYFTSYHPSGTTFLPEEQSKKC